jgi:hypothetical protein
LYIIGKGATAEEKLRKAVADFEKGGELRPELIPQMASSLEKCREYLGRD